MTRSKSWIVRYGTVLSIVVFAALITQCRGCVESSFDLLPDSRLPVWFSLPPNTSRSQVTVRLSYYTSGAEFEMYSLVPERHKIASIFADSKNHPLVQQAGYGVSDKPSYSLVTAKQQQDIVQHPLDGPYFRMVDTVAVTHEDRLAVLRGEVRRLDKNFADRASSATSTDLLEVASLAFKAEDCETVKSYALASLNHKGGCCWDDIHQANILLGRCALRDGDTGMAIEYLNKAGSVKGSSSLSTFGPNMALAKELLEKGQKEAVLSYLDAVSKFWKMGKSEILAWKIAIQSGKTPDFGANVLYDT